MKFKSWKDKYLFLKEYANASCFNCKYCGELKDSNDDRDYVRTFCTKHISIVEFQFQVLCGEWEHEDTHEKLNEFEEDTPFFKINDGLLNKLDKYEKELNFEEIQKIINMEDKQ